MKYYWGGNIIVKLYGFSGAEMDVLKKCPSRIKKFGEIKPTLSNLKNELEEKRNRFFDDLPNLIDKEQKELKELQNEEKEVENGWDIKIGEIKKDLDDNKWKFWLYFDLLIKKYISKPKAINNIQNEIKKQDDLLYELRKKPEDYFERIQIEIIDDINQLKKVVKSPEYQGAYGELRVEDELKKLSNDFHVISNVDIKFNHWIYYNGRRNLREAQMDYVVIGPTGIFIIEVKNWSNETLNNKRFSPHEQVDRAGKVLWTYIKNKSFFYKPRITQIIVPIRHNIDYNKKYKFVFIKDVQYLKSFIENNTYSPLSENKVNRFVSLLRNQAN